MKTVQRRATQLVKKNKRNFQSFNKRKFSSRCIFFPSEYEWDDEKKVYVCACVWGYDDRKGKKSKYPWSEYTDGANKHFTIHWRHLYHFPFAKNRVVELFSLEDWIKFFFLSPCRHFKCTKLFFCVISFQQNHEKASLKFGP